MQVQKQARVATEALPSSIAMQEVMITGVDLLPDSRNGMVRLAVPVVPLPENQAHQLIDAVRNIMGDGWETIYDRVWIEVQRGLLTRYLAEHAAFVSERKK